MHYYDSDHRPLDFAYRSITLSHRELVGQLRHAFEIHLLAFIDSERPVTLFFNTVSKTLCVFPEVEKIIQYDQNIQNQQSCPILGQICHTVG